MRNVGNIILISIISILFLNCSNLDKNKEENKNSKIEKIKETELYYSTKYGGLLGDIQEITFSKDSIGLINGAENLTFYTDEIYYKIENNYMIIFAPEPSYKTEQLSNFLKYLKVTDLKNYDEIKDYSENYKKYNLHKISIK